MDREAARQAVKAGIPVSNYLEKSARGNYCCPYCGSGTHANRSGAVKIYKDTNKFYCHACHKGGDVIDLYQQVTGADNNTAFTTLARELGITVDPYIPEPPTGRQSDPAERATRAFKQEGNTQAPLERKSPQKAAQAATEQTRDLTPYYRECRGRLSDPAAVAYLTGRGISIDTAAQHWLGYDPVADPAEGGHPAPRIIVPVNKQHYVGRRIDGNPHYRAMNNKHTPGIFNQQVLCTEVQEVFVVEGVFDALSILEAEHAAIATNSANNVDNLLELLEGEPTEAVLILAFDNDPTPETAKRVKEQRQKLEAGLTRLGIAFVVADICGEYKDANDYLTHDRAGFVATIEAVAREATETRERKAAGIMIDSEPQAKAQQPQRAKPTGRAAVDAFLRSTYTTKYKPLQTGIKAIDDLLHGGLLPQTLTLLGAPPGAGKTSLATMIFESMARAGHKGIYFNLEMGSDQLMARSIARIAYTEGINKNLDALDILQGYKQDEKTRREVREAATIYQDTIADNLEYNPGETGADLTKILQYLETAGREAQAAGEPAPNVCIDYLQILGGQPGEETAATIKRAVTEFKRYAINYNAIVFCIMAQSRRVNESKEATISAGRDSSALEYGADLQLQLKDDKNSPQVKLSVTKSRFTKPTEMNFTFHGAQSYFSIEPTRPQKAGRRIGS